MDLANIDPRVNVVYLSFANPNTTYKAGSKTLAGTGLDFNQDWAVVAGAISLLKARGVCVMLAVGGATYQFNPNMSVTPVCDLARDLGCDGIDIDWEPTNGARQEDEFPILIQKFRSDLGPTKKLCAAVFSTGAYGKDGDTYKGMNIKGLVQQGSSLDWLNIMAYDAGPPPPQGMYDPLGAFSAYRLYYPGPLVFGFQPGPMGWGGHLITLEEVKKNTAHVFEENKTNGIFIWSYQKNTAGSPSVKDIIDIAATPSVPTEPPKAHPKISVPSVFTVSCPKCETSITHSVY